MMTPKTILTELGEPPLSPARVRCTSFTLAGGAAALGVASSVGGGSYSTVCAIGCRFSSSSSPSTKE